MVDNMVDNISKLKYGVYLSVSDIESKKTKINNINCIQIFIGTPYKFQIRNLIPSTCSRLQRVTSSGIPIYVHSRYVINLARDDTYEKYTNMMNVSIQDLIIAGNTGCEGVIYHIGKYVDMDKNIAMNNMFNNIKCIIDNTTLGNVILETPAGTGSDLCDTLERLAFFYNKFPQIYKQRIKLCVDTAHIWASGYKINTTNGLLNYIAEFNNSIGWKNLVVIHLNDSKVECNSRKDRHEDITKGKIWQKNTDSLHLLLFICQETNKHVILETPSTRKKNLHELKIINKLLINTNKFRTKLLMQFIKTLI